MGTVLTATEVAGGGQAALRGQSNGPTVYEETYHFIVQATSASENRISVITSPGLPIPNFTATAGGLCVCREVTAIRRPSPNRRLWDVTATFSTAEQEDQGRTDFPQQFADPTTWVPVVQLKFSTIESQEMFDVNGNFFCSTAGEPLFGSFTRRDTLTSLEFTKFYPSSVLGSTIASWNNRVNSAPISLVGESYGARRVLLEIKDATRGYYNGFLVWRVNYSLKVKTGSVIAQPALNFTGKNTVTPSANVDMRLWERRVANTGTYFLLGGRPPIGPAGPKRYFRTIDKNQHIGFLQANGDAAIVTDNGLPVDSPILVYREYQVLNFAGAPGLTGF